MSALRFWHDFRKTFCKIKHKLYIASGSAHPQPPPPSRRKDKIWMCLYSCYGNCQRKFSRWCNSKDNKTIHDNMKHFQATSSISYCKPTSRRHELLDRKQRRKKSVLEYSKTVSDATATANRGVYASSPENATNWWFCVVHKHYFTEWETSLNFRKRYLHWTYNGDEVTINDAWFHVRGCTNSKNNRQWSKNTVIILEVLLHDE